MLPGALSPDLGKQERTPTRQTTTGVPTPQQDHRAGPCRWSGDWRSADADPIEELRRGSQQRPSGHPDLSSEDSAW